MGSPEFKELPSREYEIIVEELVVQLRSLEPGEGFTPAIRSLLEEVALSYPDKYVNLYFDIFSESFDSLGLLEGRQAFANHSDDRFAQFYNKNLRATKGEKIDAAFIQNPTFNKDFIRNTGFGAKSRSVRQLQIKLYIFLLLQVKKSLIKKNEDMQLTENDIQKMQQFFSSDLINPFTLMKVLQQSKVETVNEDSFQEQKTPVPLPVPRITTDTVSHDTTQQQLQQRKKVIDNFVQSPIPKIEIPISPDPEEELRNKQEKEKVNTQMEMERLKHTIDPGDDTKQESEDEAIPEKLSAFGENLLRKSGVSMDHTYESHENDPTIVGYCSIYPEFSSLGASYLFLGTTNKTHSWKEYTNGPGVKLGKVRCGVSNGALIPTLGVGSKTGMIKTMPDISSFDLYGTDGKKLSEAEKQKYRFSVQSSSESDAYRITTNFTGIVEYDVIVKTEKELTGERYTADGSREIPEALSGATKEILGIAKDLVEEGDAEKAVYLILEKIFTEKFQYTTLKDRFNSDWRERDRNPEFMYGDCDVLAEQFAEYLEVCGIESSLSACILDMNHDNAFMAGESHSIVEIILPSGKKLAIDVTNWVDMAPFQSPELLAMPRADLNPIGNLDDNLVSPSETLQLSHLIGRIMVRELEEISRMEHDEAEIYLKGLLLGLEQKESLSSQDAIIYSLLFEQCQLYDSSIQFSDRVYTVLRSGSLYLEPEAYLSEFGHQQVYTSGLKTYEYMEPFFDAPSWINPLVNVDDQVVINSSTKTYGEFLLNSGRVNDRGLVLLEARDALGHIDDSTVRNEKILLDNGSRLQVEFHGEKIKQVIYDDYVHQFDNGIKYEICKFGVIIIEKTPAGEDKIWLLNGKDGKELITGVVDESVEALLEDEDMVYLYSRFDGMHHIYYKIESDASVSELELEFAIGLYDFNEKGYLYIDDDQNPRYVENPSKICDMLVGRSFFPIRYGFLTNFSTGQDVRVDYINHQGQKIPLVQSGVGVGNVDIKFNQEGTFMQVDIPTAQITYRFVFNDDGTVKQSSHIYGWLTYDQTPTLTNLTDEPFSGVVDGNVVSIKDQNTGNFLSKNAVLLAANRIQPQFFTNHRVNYLLKSTDPLFAEKTRSAFPPWRTERQYETLLQWCWENKGEENFNDSYIKLIQLEKEEQRLEKIYEEEISSIQEKRMIDYLWKRWAENVDPNLLKEKIEVTIKAGTHLGDKIQQSGEFRDLVPGSPEWKKAILQHYVFQHMSDRVQQNIPLVNEKGEKIKDISEIEIGELSYETMYFELTGGSEEDLEREKTNYVLTKIANTPGMSKLSELKMNYYREFLENQERISESNKLLLEQFTLFSDKRKVKLLHELVNYQPDFFKEYIYPLVEYPKTDNNVEEAFNILQEGGVSGEIERDVKKSLGFNDDGTYTVPIKLERNQIQYDMESVDGREAYRLEEKRKLIRALPFDQKLELIHTVMQTYLTREYQIDPFNLRPEDNN